MRVDIGDGVRLYVDMEARGLVPDGPAMVERPTVLLLHGGPGMDHSIFKVEPIHPLADLAQIVYYDHRGNGRSDRRTPEEWTLDVWADDVVRLCDALGIEHPIVFGASFGGFVAQRYLARHPDHPARVVLACTGSRLDVDVIAESFAGHGGELAGETARKLFSGDFGVMDDFVTHCTPLYTTQSVDLDAMARVVINVDLMLHFFAGEGRTMDLRDGLADAACPVLVVGGELDPVMPPPLTRETYAALPAALARYEVIPGLSHLDVGDGSLAVVRNFVSDDAAAS